MNINISQWIEKNAHIYREKTALEDDLRTVSYNALDQRVNQLAAGLKAIETAPGDRVALLMPNNIEMIEWLFATARVGGAYVPLNWRLGEDELAFILSDCSPTVLAYEGKWRERAVALKERTGLPLTLVEVTRDDSTPPEGIASYEAFLAAQSTDRHDAIGGGDDTSMIIYTSGTTGNPKGVMLTHNNVFWQSINGWALGVSPDNICLALLPLFHVGGLNGSVTPILHVGGTVILQQKFDPGVVLNTIATKGVNGVLGVPTIYRFLADHEDFASTDLSGCDVLLSGGAPLPESLIQLYQERGLEFRQGYGLTEACPGVTGMGPGECLRKAGSAGRPILYTDVKVVDPDGNDLPVGEAGEVIVRGPNVMKGYWNRPDATAEALRNGWLHTGDVGKFDEDGFLYIVDRKKDMIISGGENIYPAEIEKLLAGHELVQMATVVARPDDKWGEIPVAVVVARTDELTEDMLRDFLKTLARYKQPKEYVFVESLPLNASGKVIKAEVRKQIGITN
jgi:fatty-acyl-CoA synthase